MIPVSANPNPTRKRGTVFSEADDELVEEPA